MKEPTDYLLERLDFNEDRIRDCLQEIKDIRSSIREVPDILKLLSSERYRIKTALNMTKNKKKAYAMLNMNERTFYRKLKEYNL